MSNLGFSSSLGLSLAAPQSSFTPTSLGAKLLGWWDAEDATTLTLATASVTTWTDKIGSYAATQGTAGNKPTYSATGFGGGNRPYVSFDGTDDYLELASQPFPATTVASNIYVVGSQDTPASDAVARCSFSYGGAAGTSRRSMERRQGSGPVNRAAAAHGTGASSVLSTQNTVDYSGIHIAAALFTATDVTAGIDNAFATAAAGVPATGTERVRIGAMPTTSPTNFWLGKINLIIVTTGTLTTDEATALYQYLQKRLT